MYVVINYDLKNFQKVQKKWNARKKNVYWKWKWNISIIDTKNRCIIIKLHLFWYKHASMLWKMAKCIKKILEWKLNTPCVWSEQIELFFFFFRLLCIHCPLFSSLIFFAVSTHEKNIGNCISIYDEIHTHIENIYCILSHRIQKKITRTDQGIGRGNRKRERKKGI